LKNKLQFNYIIAFYYARNLCNQEASGTVIKPPADGATQQLIEITKTSTRINYIQCPATVV